MLTLACLLAVAFSPLAVQKASASSNGVVISSFYARGGSSGATYINKYVELFNAGSSPVVITGWTVRYSSATGTWPNSGSNVTTIPTFTLQPGQYYLVQGGSNGANGVALPTPDATGSINSSATAGKIGLFTGVDACATADPTTCTGFVDFIGYGATANASETAVGPAHNLTEMTARKNGGCTDTDNNSTDFEVVAANARNSSTTFAPCTPPAPNLVLTSSESGDPIATNQTVTYTFNSSNTGSSVTDAALTVDFTGAITNITPDAGCTMADADTMTCSFGALTSTVVSKTAIVTPSGTGTLTADGTLTATGATNATSGQSTTVTVPDPAALSLSITENTDPVAINNAVEYTVTLTNTGDLDATTVGLSLNFSGTSYPAAYSGVSGTSGCTNVGIDNPLTCAYATLGGGQSVVIVLSVTPTVDGAITLAASATADGALTANDSETTTVTLVNPTSDVSVNLTESVASVASDQTVDITFTVSNAAGGGTANNVSLAGSFSGAITGYTFQSGGTACTADTATTFTCAYAAIAPNASETVVVRVNPEVNVAGESQVLTSNATVSASAPETGGNNTDSETTTINATCGDASHKIYNFQDNGASFGSGGTRVFEGVVTGDFQLVSPNGLGGFYMQEVTGDGNTSTSDGIWVVLPNTTFDVVVGEKVRLTGTPGETFNQTSISSTSNRIRCGTGFTIAATPITLPMSLATRENYEGMLVSVTSSGAALTVNEAYQLNNFGEIVVGVGRRYQPTTQVEPGAPAIAAATANAEALLLIDDGRDGQPPAGSVPHIGSDGSTFLRMGSTTTSLTGVMGYGFNVYRLQPTIAPSWTVAPRPTSSPDVGGRVKVASFNVLNFFNGNGAGSGFPTSRGATTTAEFARQLEKLTIAVNGLSVDVVGLMEIENDAGANQALQTLITSLNAYDDANDDVYTWDFIDADIIGTDEIKVAIIYNSETVEPFGVYDILDDVDPFDRTSNGSRPPLAQSFIEVDTDQTFTVVVNHFKSKGGSGSGSDADSGDGQGAWNATRIASAEALLDWFAGNIPTNSFDVADDTHIIIMGDLNSYALEDPIDVLKAGGFHDMIRDYDGATAYGYVFGSVSGYLDYMMADSALIPYVTDVADWHINADEPDGRDYNDDVFSGSGEHTNQAEFYRVDEFRTSDHDPILMGFSTPGTEGEIDVAGIITEGDTLTVTVTDPDWVRTSITVTITTLGGDSETLSLPETATPGVFSQTIPTVADSAIVTVGNGTLEVEATNLVDDEATVTYVDPLNALGAESTLTSDVTIEPIGGGVDGTTGTLTVTGNIVPGGDLVTITVVDPDLTGTNVEVEAITDNGDVETLTLVGAAGTYTLNIDTAFGIANIGNDVVETVNGDVITFTYTDDLNDDNEVEDITGLTTVTAINASSIFTLISPVADAVLLTSDAAATFTWNQASDDNAYTLYVFKLSDNVRVGVTLQVGVEANDACASGICTYAADPSDFDSGKYAWTVISDGTSSIEASNGGIVFNVNVGDIELVLNGGFEIAGATNGKPADWKGSRLTNDKRACSAKGNGSDCALTFTGGGVPTNPLFKQLLNFSPYAIAGGETLTISADVFSSKTAPGAVVLLNLVYVDPTAGVNGNGKDKFVINPTGLTPNTYTSLTTTGVLDGVVKKATLVVQYRQPNGKLRLDNVSVVLNGEVVRATSNVLPLPSAPDGFRGNN